MRSRCRVILDVGLSRRRTRFLVAQPSLENQTATYQLPRTSEHTSAPACCLLFGRRLAILLHAVAAATSKSAQQIVSKLAMVQTLVRSIPLAEHLTLQLYAGASQTWRVLARTTSPCRQDATAACFNLQERSSSHITFAHFRESFLRTTFAMSQPGVESIRPCIHLRLIGIMFHCHDEILKQKPVHMNENLMLLPSCSARPHHSVTTESASDMVRGAFVAS